MAPSRTWLSTDVTWDDRAPLLFEAGRNSGDELALSSKEDETMMRVVLAALMTAGTAALALAQTGSGSGSGSSTSGPTSPGAAPRGTAPLTAHRQARALHPSATSILLHRPAICRRAKAMRSRPNPRLAAPVRQQFRRRTNKIPHQPVVSTQTRALSPAVRIPRFSLAKTRPAKTLSARATQAA